VNQEMQDILKAAKDVAVRFKNLTGKPLGVINHHLRWWLEM
jgi:hypothetical protein